MAVKGLNFRISGTNAAGPALNQLNNQLQTVQRTTQRMAPLQASWNKGLNENRRMVQQLGFQIGDFATQIAGGQNAMLAFVQQGGQVLQFFGPFGAVLAAALAVFGSLGLAMYKSGVSMSQVLPIMGVFQDELYYIIEGVKKLIDVFFMAANLIVNNLDTIAIFLGLVAGQALARYVVAMVAASTASAVFAANTAAFGLVMGTFRTAIDLTTMALTRLRAIMMTVLPVALLVGLAVIIQKLWELRNATGSWGETFKLVWDLAKAVFNGLIEGVKGVGQAFYAVAKGIEAEFLSMLSRIMSAFVEMTWTIAEGMNNLMGTSFQGASFEGANAVVRASLEAADASTAAAAQASSSWQNAADGVMAAWKPISDLLSGDTTDVRDWFGGGGDDGKGKGGGGKSPADKLSEEAKRIKEIYGQISESISSTMLSGFKEVVKGAKSLKDYALESLNAILDSIQDVLLSPIFDAIGKGIGGAILGAVGYPQYDFGGLPSMDGGGHTGRGSRSGGLDGKGGFLSLLHPNETVIDHTKGGSLSGGGQVVVRMVVEEAEGFASRVGAISQQSAIGVVAQFERKRLSAAVQRAQAKPRVK